MRVNKNKKAKAVKVAPPKVKTTTAVRGSSSRRSSSRVTKKPDQFVAPAFVPKKKKVAKKGDVPKVSTGVTPKKKPKRKVPKKPVIGVPYRKGDRLVKTLFKKPIRDDEDDEETEDEDDDANKKTGKKSKGKKAPKAKKESKAGKKGNDRLTPRTGIEQYKENPFFSQAAVPEYVSASTQARLVFRAIARKNIKELQTAMNSETVHHSLLGNPFSYADSRDADAMVLLSGDLNLMKEYYKLKKNLNTTKELKQEPNLLMRKQSGRNSYHMIGRHTRAIEMTRGGREGNNAFLNYEAGAKVTVEDGDHLQLLINKGVSYVDIEKYSKVPNSTVDSGLHGYVVKAARMGHRKLAADLASGPDEYGFNELHKATLKGSTLPDKILQVSCIKKGHGNQNITPMHTAAINPDSKVLEKLRSIEPNISLCDLDNWQPIHYAAVCEGTGPLEFLLKNGASVNSLNKKHESPLHCAARAGRPANIKIILKALTELESAADNLRPDRSLKNARTRAGNTALHMAVQYESMDAIKALLEDKITLIDHPNSVNNHKLTALMMACGRGNLDIANLLIEKGALIEGKDKLKRSPLIHAAINGQVHIMAMLIAKGADILRGDTSGNTACHYAAAYGWELGVRLLSSVDPSCVSKENDWKITPFSIAYLKGHYGIVAWMLNGPHKDLVDINAKDTEGMTLLASLLKFSDENAQSRLPAEMKFLLDKGADCSLTDSLGNNILHVFASMKIRTKKDTDKTKENRNRMTDTEYRGLYEAIIANGGKVDVKNQSGESPIHIALESYNLKLFTWMLSERKDAPEFLANVKWPSGNNILHEILSFPSNLWSSTDWNNEDTPDPEQYDILSFLKNEVMTHCRVHLATLMSEKEKEGMDPIMCAIKKYSALTDRGRKVRPFIDYMSTVFQWIFETFPSALMLSYKVCEENGIYRLQTRAMQANQDEDTAEPARFQWRGLMSLATEVQLEKECLTLLKTIVKVGKDKKKIKDMLLFEHNLVANAMDKNRTAAKYFIELAKEIGCADGVHNAVLARESVHGKEVHKSVVQLIIEKGEFGMVETLQLTQKDWNHLDNDQNSVWHYAAKSNHHKTISLLKLLESKGIPRKANILGATPLHVAVESCDGGANAVLEPIEWLAGKGDVAVSDKAGRTPLHYVFATRQEFEHKRIADVCKDPIAVVSILSNAMNKKELDVADVDGNTPLHLAAFKNANICAVTLTRRGCDVNKRNKDGNTPLAIAVLHSRQSVALTLIQANSSVTDAVFPMPPKPTEKENLWVWEGVKKVVEVAKESTIPAEVVARGGGWESMVYVLLDTLGKNPTSLAQLIDAALKQKQYNLANQLLKSLEAYLDGKPLVTKYNLLLTFVDNLVAGSSIADDSIEGTVLGRLFDVGCPLLINQKSPPIEAAFAKGHYEIIQYFKNKLGAQWSTLVPVDEKHGPLYYCMKNIAARKIANKPEGEQLLEKAMEFASTDINRCLSFELPVFSSINTPVPAISWAAVHGNHHLIRLLRKVGADVNARENINGSTPIMLAVMSNKPMSIEALCGNGELLQKKTVKPKSKNSNNNIGLSFAGGIRLAVVPRKTPGRGMKRIAAEPSSSSDEEENEEAAESGNNPSDEDSEDETPKGRKARELTPRKKIRLVNKDVDLTAIDNKGRNMLHYMVIPEHWENDGLLEVLNKQNSTLVKDLLAQPDHDLNRPLDYALMTHQRRMAAAMVNIRNRGDDSARVKRGMAPRLPDVSNLVCPYDVSQESKLFIEEYAKEHDKVKVEEKEKPHSMSGYELTGEIVFCEETSQPMSVLLHKTDVQYGRYGFHNFYRMQLLKRRDADLWILFTNWGRIGGGQGAHQTTPFNTIESAVKEFKSVFNSKTGQQWLQLNDFVEIKNKYRLVKVDRSPNSLADIKLPPRPTDKVKETDPIRRFLKDISDVGKLKEYAHCFSDIMNFNLPFGRVPLELIERAKKILDECQKNVDELKEVTKKENVASEEVLVHYVRASDLANQFYEVVPSGDCEYSSLSRFDDDDSISKARSSLMRMEEVEVGMRLITAAEHHKGDRLEFLRQAVQCHFEIKTPDDAISQNILRYITTTSKDKHKVKGIIEIAPKNAVEAFVPFMNEKDHLFLWHGTRAMNLLSILHDGFRLDPLNAAGTGKLHGNGMYLADAFQKSTAYCHPSVEGAKYMLLCQVALGKVLEQSERHDETPQKDHDTLYVKNLECPSQRLTVAGVPMPLGPIIKRTSENSWYYGNQSYSEYIVRDPSRVLPRYIVIYK